MVYSHYQDYQDDNAQEDACDYYEQQAPAAEVVCSPCGDPCASDCCREFQHAGWGIAILVLAAALLFIIVLTSTLTNAVQLQRPANPFENLLLLSATVALGWFGVPLGFASPFVQSLDIVIALGKSCCPCPPPTPKDGDQACFQEYLLGAIWVLVQIASAAVLALALFVAVIILLMVNTDAV